MKTKATLTNWKSSTAAKVSCTRMHRATSAWTPYGGWFPHIPNSALTILSAYGLKRQCNAWFKWINSIYKKNTATLTRSNSQKNNDTPASKRKLFGASLSCLCSSGSSFYKNSCPRSLNQTSFALRKANGLLTIIEIEGLPTKLHRSLDTTQN